MPGNLTCDQCRKHIGDYANAYFSDRGRNIDFCSEKCQLEASKNTLQEYLNQQYPTQVEKEQLKEIIIGQMTYSSFESNLPLKSRELAGKELDLSEYPNLEKASIIGSHLKFPLTKL